MKINDIYISNFGKLKDISFEFTNGINVIFGNNETGKSTLQTFIKGMFFSLKGGRILKNKELPELKKYLPFGNSNTYMGTLRYTLDNSEKFLIERDFSSQSVKIYDNTLKDISKTFEVNKDCGVMFAKKHLGITESLFEKTCFIKQSGVTIDNVSGKTLIENLSNQSNSDLEIISFKKAETALKKALKEYVGTDKTQKSPLDLINSELDDIYHTKKALEEKKIVFSKLQSLSDSNEKKDVLLSAIAISKSNKDLNSELIYSLEQINLYEEKLDNLSKSDDLDKQINQLKEKLNLSECTLNKYKIFNKLDKNITEHLLNYTSEKESLKGTFSSLINTENILKVDINYLTLKNKILNFSFSFFILLSILLFLKYIVSLKPIILFCVIGFFTLAIGTLKFKFDNKNKLNSTLKKINDTTLDIKNINTKIAHLENNINTIISRVNVSSIEEFIKLKTEYDGEIKLFTSYNESISNLENQIYLLNESKKNYLGLIDKTYTNLLKKFNLLEIESKLLEIEHNLSILNSKKSNLLDLDFSLKTALDILKQSNEELNSDFIPKLNKNLSNIINKITDGQYLDLHIDNELNINVINKNSPSVINYNYLSCGTVDQIYLALRLAISEIISNTHETLPLIFDEVFSTYDDIRTKQTLKLLKDISKKRQVILFTCKNREIELLEEIVGNSNFKLINLR